MIVKWFKKSSCATRPLAKKAECQFEKQEGFEKRKGGFLYVNQFRLAMKSNSKFSFPLRARGKNQRTAKRKENRRIASVKYHFCDLAMWS